MDPYYLVGEDELDDDEVELLGELLGDEDAILGQRAALHRRLSAQRGMNARTRVRRALVPKTPGVPRPGARELPLGFTVANFTNTTAAALNVVARPQMPFKGRRLIVEVTLSAAGVGGAIVLTDIRVGQRSQPVSAAPIPVGTFAANAFGIDLALDPCDPGIEVTIGYALGVACGVGETVDITTVLIGLAIA